MAPQRFKIGQTVACKGNSFDALQWTPQGLIHAPLNTLPKASEIYTVTGYEAGQYPGIRNQWFIYLAELDPEVSWNESDF